MAATITNIQPNPLHVLSGQRVVLVITVVSVEEHVNVQLVITNLQPLGADLFDNKHPCVDKITLDSQTIHSGINNLQHEVGFKLQGNNQHGAVIGIEVQIKDIEGNEISTARQLLAVIGAT